MSESGKPADHQRLERTIHELTTEPTQEGKFRILARAMTETAFVGPCRVRYSAYDRSRNILSVRFATGDYGDMDPRNVSYSVNPSTTLSGHALVNNQLLLYSSSTEEGIVHTPWWPSGTSAKAFIACPVTSQNKVVGVLTIDSAEDARLDLHAIEAIRPYSDLIGVVVGAAGEPPQDPIISSISRYRRRQLLVLGKDTDPEAVWLTTMVRMLRDLGYLPLLVKEHPDIPELSNEEKVRVMADLSRFVVLENSFPAGQIAECKMCATNRIITASLRQQGKGSSYMVTDYFKDYDFMSDFTYLPTEDSLRSAIQNAVQWAESKIRERIEYYDGLYPWRQSGDDSTDPHS